MVTALPPAPRSTDLSEAYLVLRSFPSMEGVEDDVVATLAEASTLRGYPAGAVVQRGGQPVSYARLIRSGAVEVRQAGRVTLTVRRPFGVGFLNILAQSPVGYEAMAMVDTLAVEIPAEVLLQQFALSARMVRRSLRLLAEDLLAARGYLPQDSRLTRTPSVGERPLASPTLVERVLSLRRESEVLRDLDVDAVIDYARHFESCVVPPGTYLWRTGDRGDHSVLLRHGIVECSAPEGRSCRVGAGFTLGTLDQLAGRPRAYDTRAVTEVHMDRIDQDAYESLLELYPSAGLMMSRILARSLIASRRARAEEEAAAQALRGEAG